MSEGGTGNTCSDNDDVNVGGSKGLGFRVIGSGLGGTSKSIAMVVFFVGFDGVMMAQNVEKNSS